MSEKKPKRKKNLLYTKVLFNSSCYVKFLALKRLPNLIGYLVWNINPMKRADRFCVTTFSSLQTHCYFYIWVYFTFQRRNLFKEIFLWNFSPKVTWQKFWDSHFVQNSWNILFETFCFNSLKPFQRISLFKEILCKIASVIHRFCVIIYFQVCRDSSVYHHGNLS